MTSVSHDPSVASPPRYRAVSPWAVLSMVCGAASVMMIFGWLAVPLPLAAIYFGLKALGKSSVPEEYTGLWLAKIGLGLGGGLGVVLSGWLSLGGNEVPHGYQRLDWADLEPNPNKKTELIPASALELSDKKAKVAVRGYILPGRRQMQLTELSFVAPATRVRFSTQMGYRPTDLIHIECTGDLTMTTRRTKLASAGSSRPTTRISAPYSIKADYVYK